MINRRTILTATLAGIPVGVAGGLFARSRQGTGASIRFLGRNKAMVALLDTGVTRALFLLGEPDVTMLANLAQLLTVGRTRVDLLVGSHKWLTTDGLRSELDLHRITTISLQADASMPPIRGEVIPITDDHLLELGDECEVLIRLTDSFSSEASDPGIQVELCYRNARIVLASRASAYLETGSLALLAAPGEFAGNSLATIKPALFVGTALPEGYDGPALRAHHNDPLTLEIKDGLVTTRGT